jgi:hypothetical protein
MDYYTKQLCVGFSITSCSAYNGIEHGVQHKVREQVIGGSWKMHCNILIILVILMTRQDLVVQNRKFKPPI